MEWKRSESEDAFLLSIGPSLQPSRQLKCFTWRTSVKEKTRKKHLILNHFKQDKFCFDIEEIYKLYNFLYDFFYAMLLYFLIM